MMSRTRYRTTSTAMEMMNEQLVIYPSQNGKFVIQFEHTDKPRLYAYKTREAYGAVCEPKCKYQVKAIAFTAEGVTMTTIGGRTFLEGIEGVERIRGFFPVFRTSKPSRD